MNTKRHFGLHGYPFPKNAKGKTFFEASTSYARLKRAFGYLIEEPGLGVLTGEAGVGKTAAMRHLCTQLPQPDYPVIYLCDTALAPLDLYRALASELGVRLAPYRSQIWADLKKALLLLVDERGQHPIIIIDEAQHLPDILLLDLNRFLNFSFDSRELFTLWIVGLPPLSRRLQQLQHAALQTRIATEVRMEPLDRKAFALALDHGFKAAGATSKQLSDPALEILFRASRGVLRLASRLLRTSLRIAEERGQTFLDESAVQSALDELTPA